MFRAAVNPFGFAFGASRKPWVTVLGHPSNACVRPLDAAGNTFSALARDASAPASLRTSPASMSGRSPACGSPCSALNAGGLPIHSKPRSSHAMSPVFHAPLHDFELPRCSVTGLDRCD